MPPAHDDRDRTELLRNLPSVDEALRTLEAEGRAGERPRWALVQAVRDEIAALRGAVLAAGSGTQDRPGAGAARTRLDPDRVVSRAEALLRPSLRPLLNATGVVLHTNLGRAPLGPRALERVRTIASGYCNLEFELDERRRGSRHHHTAEILRRVTGAEEALVVNNNAAAVLLCLAALARGREVVVSRGELVEIGGSFRLPDVMTASGAILREVGTTNRTHPRDYEDAITDATALLMKAHRSNFALVGFTAEVSAEELVGIGRRRNLPTLYDLGSGCLLPLEPFGLPGEPTVDEVLRAGFDLVTFSGDKLLGGPQAGLIVGRASILEKIRTHPLVRPLRPDKMTLAALEATLEAYRDGRAPEELPVHAMLSADRPTLERRAALAARLIRTALEAIGLDPPFVVEVEEVSSAVGGGALPLASPPSFAVALSHPSLGPDLLEARLRGGDPPVLGRVSHDRLLLDIRTVLDAEVELLARAAAVALVGASAISGRTI
jgi:L-seryl-tRNA(Ser) seleniumtransferase